MTADIYEHGSVELLREALKRCALEGGERTVPRGRGKKEAAQEAASMWWRWGRVELPVQATLLKDILQA